MSEIHDAIKEGNADKLWMILQKSPASINIADNLGTSLLHLAAEKGKANVVKVLLTAKADPRVKDSRGLTPLHVAAEQGQAEIIRMLAAGAELNAVDKSGKTPLHLAVAKDKVEAVKALLEQPAIDPSVKDSIGNTPLHLAMEKCNPVIVQALLAGRADRMFRTRPARRPCTRLRPRGTPRWWRCCWPGAPT